MSSIQLFLSFRRSFRSVFMLPIICSGGRALNEPWFRLLFLQLLFPSLSASPCTASRTASRTCSSGVVSARIGVHLHAKTSINTVFIADLGDLRTGSIPACAGKPTAGPEAPHLHGVDPRALGVPGGGDGDSVGLSGLVPARAGRTGATTTLPGPLGVAPCVGGTQDRSPSGPRSCPERFHEAA